jgi:hypothetical protein
MKIEAESKFEIGDVVKHVGTHLCNGRSVVAITEVGTITCTAGTQFFYTGRPCEPHGVGGQTRYNECELAPLTDEDRLGLGGASWKKTLDKWKERTSNTDAPSQ